MNSKPRMKVVRMLVELSYDAESVHGDDKEAKDWFFKYILGSRRKRDLILHSNEIGDEVGTIKVLSYPMSSKKK